jgi:AraC-like DNA-binding protein
MNTVAELIARHASNRPTYRKFSGDQRAIQLIKDFIHDAFDQHISLKQLSSLAGLSPYYLTRLFKKATGLPPHAYLTQTRLKHAKAMLRQGIPLADTAIRTGFVDQSHFNRQFKKWTGVTPGEYRRK